LPEEAKNLPVSGGNLVSVGFGNHEKFRWLGTETRRGYIEQEMEIWSSPELLQAL